MFDKEMIINLEAENVLQTYVRPEILFTHGRGLTLTDSEGKAYLDFTAGIAVTVLGHSDPEWAAAVAQQASQLTHVSNLYHTAPQALLAEKLVSSSFADKVYFCNSGAEANEAALKFARKWAKLTGHTGKTKIVAFSGGFHGRSAGALSVTYKEKYRAPFAPLLPNVTFVPFNDLAAASEAVDDDTCAVIVEPVQGEGGVNPAQPEFLRGLRALCDQHDALLIFDEVQCGLGRSGRLWAYELVDVTPDIMTLAKPLAGGLPIGATLVTQAVADQIHPGDHGSTFAAGPLVCAAANVVVDRVNQPDFLRAVSANGAYLREKLIALASEHVREVRGLGLLVAAELDCPVGPVISAAREKGLMLISAGENVLRLAPALTVTPAQIDQAVGIIGDCLAEQS